MVSAAQLPLLASADSALGDEFLRVLRGIVERIGLKQVAGELDCSPSFLANALAARGSNHLRAEWVPWLLRNDVAGEALRFLADLCGQELSPVRKMTVEEELMSLKRAIDEELGPAMQQVLLAKARRNHRGGK